MVTRSSSFFLVSEIGEFDLLSTRKRRFSWVFAAVTPVLSDFGQFEFDAAEIVRIRPAQRLPGHRLVFWRPNEQGLHAWTQDR